MGRVSGFRVEKVEETVSRIIIHRNSGKPKETYAGLVGRSRSSVGLISQPTGTEIFFIGHVEEAVAEDYEV